MLEQLKPSLVWKYFEDFCAIPHPSGHEERAAKYILDCASKLKLPAIRDATGNILIRKPSSSNDKKETVILQSHLDMVPQKNNDSIHNFITDPIRPKIEGDWVKASGTTLGSDNGIGVAIALAVLENRFLQHGPIEALFTLDEERGMTGAFGLTPDFLQGKMLINLDTENESEICIGCAGGTDIIATLPYTTLPTPSGISSFTIALTGLQGGHSGMEIHLGRANALKLIARILNIINSKFPIHIVDIHGGTARNAIPREVFVVIAIPSENDIELSRIISDQNILLSQEFSKTDPNLSLKLSESSIPNQVIAPTASANLLTILSEMPNGVLAMDSMIENIVQTSNNTAIIKCNGTSFHIACMLRSSKEADLVLLKDAISNIFKSHNATISLGSIYPGWQPIHSSRLLSVMKTAYTKVHGKPPIVAVVHAGLECGIIGGKYPGMEMVSCGPTIHFAHSPDEQMHIPSVERFWNCLTKVLEII